LAPGLTKVLVAAGNRPEVEVINLDASRPSLVCKDMPPIEVSNEFGEEPFPSSNFHPPAFGATGQLLHGDLPFVMTDQLGPDCGYVFNNGTWAWTPVSNPSLCRAYAASVPLSSQAVLVAGGLIGGSPSASVGIFDGSAWTALADLPVTLAGHCIVKIHRSLLLVIGGAISGLNYFYFTVFEKF
jgi:hypothetical protein